MSSSLREQARTRRDGPDFAHSSNRFGCAVQHPMRGQPNAGRTFDVSSIGSKPPDVEAICAGVALAATLDGMSKTDDRDSGARERSPVERIAAGVVGSDAMKSATKRALEARERAVELQEFTLGALNLPSAAVIDRLTRRVRSVALRLESIEDGLDRLEERLEDAAPAAPAAAASSGDLEQVLARLSSIEQRLEALQAPAKAAPAARKAPARKPAAAKATAAKTATAKPATKTTAAKSAAPKPSAGSR